MRSLRGVLLGVLVLWFCFDGRLYAARKINEMIMQKYVSDARSEIIFQEELPNITAVEKYILTQVRGRSNASEIADAILQAHLTYQVPMSLIMAVIEIESGWDKEAISSAGAKGFMQIHYETQCGKDIWANKLKQQGLISGTEDYFETYSNISCGTYILKNYLLKTSSLENALYRYVGAPVRDYYLMVSNLEHKIHIFLRLASGSNWDQSRLPDNSFYHLPIPIYKPDL